MLLALTLVTTALVATSDIEDQPVVGRLAAVAAGARSALEMLVHWVVADRAAEIVVDFVAGMIQAELVVQIVGTVVLDPENFAEAAGIVEGHIPSPPAVVDTVAAVVDKVAAVVDTVAVVVDKAVAPLA